MFVQHSRRAFPPAALFVEIEVDLRFACSPCDVYGRHWSTQMYCVELSSVFHACRSNWIQSHMFWLYTGFWLFVSCLLMGRKRWRFFCRRNRTVYCQPRHDHRRTVECHAWDPQQPGKGLWRLFLMSCKFNTRIQPKIDKISKSVKSHCHHTTYFFKWIRITSSNLWIPTLWMQSVHT